MNFTPIGTILSSRLNDLIIYAQFLSKEALRKYSVDTVNAVGAQWKAKDTFGYDLDMAKLEQIKAGK